MSVGGEGKRVCPDCKGRGRTWVKMPGERSVELSCGTCFGSGRLQRKPQPGQGVRIERQP